ncbi:MAG: hypothetical protein ACYC7E_13285 [Armatimonadota bacterium]
MPMAPFLSRFYDLAIAEMRTLIIRNYPELPDGTYGFLELYCDEPACDCRRVTIDVIEAGNPTTILATISYGWESEEFYGRWVHNADLAKDVKGPSLDPINPQSQYSETFLRLFTEQLNDEAYVARLKRHYALFRTAIQQAPTIRPATASIRTDKSQRRVTKRKDRRKRSR